MLVCLNMFPMSKVQIPLFIYVLVIAAIVLLFQSINFIAELRTAFFISVIISLFAAFISYLRGPKLKLEANALTNREVNIIK